MPLSLSQVSGGEACELHATQALCATVSLSSGIDCVASAFYFIFLAFASPPLPFAGRDRGRCARAAERGLSLALAGSVPCKPKLEVIPSVAIIAFKHLLVRNETLQDCEGRLHLRRRAETERSGIVQPGTEQWVSQKPTVVDIVTPQKSVWAVHHEPFFDT